MLEPHEESYEFSFWRVLMLLYLGKVHSGQALCQAKNTTGTHSCPWNGNKLAAVILQNQALWYSLPLRGKYYRKYALKSLCSTIYTLFLDIKLISQKWY